MNKKTVTSTYTLSLSFDPYAGQAEIITGENIMTMYYINQDQTNNPGYHHEVHTREHAEELHIQRKYFLGFFPNEVEAVQAGKRIYSDADGCAVCCPRAHRG